MTNLGGREKECDEHIYGERGVRELRD